MTDQKQIQLMDDANEESMLADDEEGNLLYLVVDVVIMSQIKFGKCFCEYGLYFHRGTPYTAEGEGRRRIDQTEGRKGDHAEGTGCRVGTLNS